MSEDRRVPRMPPQPDHSAAETAREEAYRAGNEAHPLPLSGAAETGGYGQPAGAHQDASRPADRVASTSDQRVVNNVMRHEYRVLSDDEKMVMQKIKDDGLAFHDYIAGLGTSRELSLAKTKVEEAVMWAVKHLTR